MTRLRVTNLEIQKWVVRTHGFVPEGPWIEHCKDLAGLMSDAEAAALNPCPPDKQPIVMQALRRLGAI
jgi:hypothetical protein